MCSCSVARWQARCTPGSVCCWTVCFWRTPSVVCCLSWDWISIISFRHSQSDDQSVNQLVCQSVFQSFPRLLTQLGLDFHRILSSQSVRRPVSQPVSLSISISILRSSADTAATGFPSHSFVTVSQLVNRLVCQSAWPSPERLLTQVELDFRHILSSQSFNSSTN